MGLADRRTLRRAPFTKEGIRMKHWGVWFLLSVRRHPKPMTIECTSGSGED